MAGVGDAGEQRLGVLEQRLAWRGQANAAGRALALAAALGYAAYVLCSATLLGTIDPLTLAALLATGSAAVLSAAAIAHGQLAACGGVTGAALVAAVALVSSVLGVGAFLSGVRRLGPGRASIVSSAEPALTAAMGFAVFGASLTTAQLAGAALVMASVPILELRPRTRRLRPGFAT